jgi:DNA-binding response OmpR family regulator
VSSILVVEDEDRIATFVAKGLRAEGFTVTCVADGGTGLDYALTGDFDLVVLDIGLPVIDGFTILDRLAADRPALPVIVLTARDSVTDTVAALEGGAADYMSKPFRFDELMARVRLRLRTGAPPASEDVLEGAGVRLDLRRRVATVGDVEVDSRRRISLGRAGNSEHTRYRVEEDDQGVLTLIPLITVPVTALTDRLRAAIAEADAGQLVERPSASRVSGDEP